MSNKSATNAPEISTEYFLLWDELFQLASEKNLTTELAEGSVVGKKEVRVIAVEHNAVTTRYSTRMIRPCYLGIKHTPSTAASTVKPAKVASTGT